MSPGANPVPPPAGAPARPAAAPSRRVRRKRLLREYAETVLFAILAALVARAFVVETFRIPTASMLPALQAGDHVLVSKLSYALRAPFSGRTLVRWAEPRRGDVVVFDHRARGGETWVKRVVGVPGDVVKLEAQVLYINGVAQPRERVGPVVVEEQSSATGTWWTESCFLWRERLARDGPATGDPVAHGVVQCREPAADQREGPFEVVKPGHVFVVGDSRDRSEDGRSGGGWQVPVDDVEGKAVRVLWSWGPDGARAGSRVRLRADRLFKPVE